MAAKGWLIPDKVPKCNKSAPTDCHVSQRSAATGAPTVALRYDGRTNPGAPLRRAHSLADSTNMDKLSSTDSVQN